MTLRTFPNLLICGLCVAAVTAAGILLIAQAEPADYLTRPKVQAFINRMVSHYGFSKTKLRQLFGHVEQQESALAAISRPAESKPWYEYREIFITPQRIQGGVQFWNENQDVLAKAEQVYGVPAAIIVAIIGVESYYGRQGGDFPVFDTLVTLGFGYPPRADFFRQELEQFLLLSREEHFDIPGVEGSYAGAMGMSQFISSSYRKFAVDFDGNGKRNLWGSPADAIGSVANYFRVHGWRTGAPVAFPAQVKGANTQSLLELGLEPTIDVNRLASRGIKAQGRIDGGQRVALLEYDIGSGMQYWVGLNNFYVITRYNHSSLYAMAVYQLSLAIEQARDSQLADSDP
jgi:membrane-bound lytic murein transglycosylase B